MRRPLLVFLAACASLAGEQRPIDFAYNAMRRAMRPKVIVRYHAMVLNAIVRWSALAASADATQSQGARRP